MLLIFLSIAVSVHGCQQGPSFFNEDSNCINESQAEMSRNQTTVKAEARNAQVTEDISPTAAPPALQTPELMSAMPSSDGTVTLVWTGSTAPAEGFIVERSLQSEDNWITVAFVARNLTEFKDSELSSGTAYRYRIRTYGRSDKSEPSCELQVKTDPQGR